MEYTVESAIDHLAELKIINSPEYWKANYQKTRFLDLLFIKSAKILTTVKPRSSTIEEGVANLVKIGIINTPDYWLNQTGLVIELLKALGGAAAQDNLKYSDANPPLICMMTDSTCYKETSKMKVKGVLWHSTGANNPTLKRYVQPSENDPKYSELMGKIGENLYKNDWNHITIKAGLNAWIGKLADGSVTTIQTMPWDYKPWGCGSGNKGSCNNGWIQFEICEDNLNNKDYFDKIYEEACELTAYLCKKYNLNPNGYVDYNGVKVPVILCHADSYKLGLGSNHKDVLHWFSKYGKNMDTVRADVNKLLNNVTNPVEKLTFDGMVTASILNVRSGPGINYEVLTTVKKGTVLELEKEQNGWGKLFAQDAWVSLNYIEKI